MLGFSAILVYLMALPYCDEAHAACSRCAQLSSFDPEPCFQLFIICSTYCQQWKAGWESENKTTYSVLNVNQPPACLYDHSIEVISEPFYFCCWGMASICSCCVYYVRRNLQSLPHREYV